MRRGIHLLLRPLAALIVAIVITSTAVAQGSSTPVCSRLALRIKPHISLQTLSTGIKVSVGVKVKNVGIKTVKGINVRVSSSVLGGWRAMGGDLSGDGKVKVSDPSVATTGWKAMGAKPATSRRTEAGVVYWLDQKLLPGQTRKYKAHARVCAGAAPGAQTLVEAAVYRLNNATVGVQCWNRAAPMNVGLSEGSGVGKVDLID
jgi:hypothetical protein